MPQKSTAGSSFHETPAGLSVRHLCWLGVGSTRFSFLPPVVRGTGSMATPPRAGAAVTVVTVVAAALLVLVVLLSTTTTTTQTEAVPKSFPGCPVINNENVLFCCNL